LYCFVDFGLGGGFWSIMLSHSGHLFYLVVSHIMCISGQVVVWL
jgi:ABC-type anion transport system duplicated permease subunit